MIIAMLVIALPGCRKKGDTSANGDDTTKVANETYEIKYELGSAERQIALRQ